MWARRTKEEVISAATEPPGQMLHLGEAGLSPAHVWFNGVPGHGVALWLNESDLMCAVIYERNAA